MKKIPFIPIIGKGDSLIQPIYIMDLVESLLKVTDADGYAGKFYSVGGKKARTNIEVFREVRDVYKLSCRFVPFNPLLIRLAIRLMEVMGVKIITREQVGRFQENKSLENNDFQNLVGRQPLSFREGLVKANYYSLLR